MKLQSLLSILLLLFLLPLAYSSLLPSSPSSLLPSSIATSSDPALSSSSSSPLSFAEAAPKKGGKDDKANNEPGFFSRLWNRIWPTIRFFILYLLPIPLLIFAALLFLYNEGRAIAHYCFVKYPLENCKEICPDEVDPKNNEKLVFLSSNIKTGQCLKDPITGLFVYDALKLTRIVEMNQKNLKGHQVWSSKKEDHEDNPSSWPIESECWISQDATIGGFRLSSSSLFALSTSIPVLILPEFQSDLEVNLLPLFPPLRRVYLLDNMLYFRQGDSIKDHIGDLRIKYLMSRCSQGSFLGCQGPEGTLAPYDAFFGRRIKEEGGGKQEEAMSKRADEGVRRMFWLHDGGLIKKELVGMHDPKPRFINVFRFLSIFLAIISVFLLLLWVHSWVNTLDFLSWLGKSLAPLGLAIIIVLAAALIIFCLMWIWVRPWLVTAIIGVVLLIFAIIWVGKKVKGSSKKNDKDAKKSGKKK